MAKKKPTAKTQVDRRRTKESPSVKAIAKKKNSKRTSKSALAKRAVKTTTAKPKRAKEPTTLKQRSKKHSSKTTRSLNAKAGNVKVRKWQLSLGRNTQLLIQINRTKQAKSKKHANKVSPRLGWLKNNYRAAIFISIGLLGSIYFASDILRPTPELRIYSPPAPTYEFKSMPVLQPKALTKSEPAKLTIADIGLSTETTTVSKQPDNTLEVPISADVPGWYNLGPTPGELGPSIIVGHVDSPRGPGVFWRLRELVPGQLIEVSRQDGTNAIFSVTKIQQFEQNNFPTAEVYGDTDHAALRLITCGGSYNKLTGNYSHNTVVFATLVQ